MEAALFVRLPGVMKMTGLGRSTIYRLMAQQQFPLPVKLSARAVGWKAQELGSWCESRGREEAVSPSLPRGGRTVSRRGSLR